MNKTVDGRAMGGADHASREAALDRELRALFAAYGADATLQQAEELAQRLQAEQGVAKPAAADRAARGSLSTV